jgi:hypothetical protein
MFLQTNSIERSSDLGLNFRKFYTFLCPESLSILLLYRRGFRHNFIKYCPRDL